MGIELTLPVCAGLIFTWIIVKFGIPLFQKYSWKKKVDELAKTVPRDTVLLHYFPKIEFPSNIKSCQPWALKLELFMKLSNIKYQIDFEIPFGPNSKSPWITLNGQHQSDSHLIIQNLKRKFDIDLNSGYKTEQLAIARSVRIMLEERFFCALPLWRFIWPEGKKNFHSEWKCLNFPFFYPLSLFRLKFQRFYKQKTFWQGIGIHSREDQLKMLQDDLRTVSEILGNKKFILGDKICEDDCAIFGMLSQPVYGMPDSPFEQIINDELPNLKEYCERIRTKYFENWDK